MYRLTDDRCPSRLFQGGSCTALRKAAEALRLIRHLVYDLLCTVARPRQPGKDTRGPSQDGERYDLSARQRRPAPRDSAGVLALRLQDTADQE
jgi:hypothetical protein